MDAPRPTCDATDCERAVYARAHCERHYRQLLRTGALSLQRREQRSCGVSSCPRRAVTRGWCHAHYLRWVRTQEVRPNEALRPRDRPGCRIADCDAPHHGHGYCRAHLARLSRWGDPRADVPLRCTSAGGWLSHGYRYVPVPAELRHLSAGATQLGEHRLVMAVVLDRALEDDEVVHHRNGDRTDNRPANLELWNTGQPKGQRVEDKLDWAREILARYSDEQALRQEGDLATKT